MSNFDAKLIVNPSDDFKRFHKLINLAGNIAKSYSGWWVSGYPGDKPPSNSKNWCECELCGGRGLVPARLSIYGHKGRKPAYCAVAVDHFLHCFECNGNGWIWKKGGLGK